MNKILPCLLIGGCTWFISACAPGDTSFAVSSQSPAIAPALPASEVANAVDGGPMAPQDAFRLLEQASFGPTLSDIEYAGAEGANTWIDQQMQLPTTFISDGLAQSDSEKWNEYINVWWRNAVTADDQLRQRVAFALSQIVVVSADDGLGDEQFGLANYYDILLRHSFGNFRNLLEDVTLSPVMGEYLGMKGNRKPAADENIQPDENFAREVLQLFTIGQVLLHDDGTPIVDSDGVPLPTYSQATIENFARIFTGWHYANADHFLWPQNSDYINPMEPWEQFHDTGAKTLLQGVEVAAGLGARQDLSIALDNIFNHPNVGPFISKQLIQRLITSNPSAQYVSDVTAVFNSNSQGERGSLASTIKAILMHREARLGHLDNVDEFGKLKEPLIRMTQLWRAFAPDSIPASFDYSWVESQLEQALLSSPTVFNFFRPDFSLPGEINDRGLVSPEFQIVDESSIIKMTSKLLSASVYSHNYNTANTQTITIDIEREMQLEPNPDELIEHLNLLLLGGRMSTELKDEVRELMSTRVHDGAESLRVTEAIFLIVTSPEAALQL